MLRLPYRPLGQVSITPTIAGNTVPFVLGMVTWAVFGGVFKSLFGVGEAAVHRGATAAIGRIQPRKQLKS